MRRTVRSLLETKGHKIWSIQPEMSVYHAIATMAEHRCGSLVVLQDGKLVGIVTERDYARKVILEGRSSRDTPVSAIMTTVVHVVEPRETMEGCMELMTMCKVRHLPVMVEQRVVGVLSIGDVISALLYDRDSTIRDLEHYIVGG